MKLNVAGNIGFDPLHFSKIDPNLRTYVDPKFCSHHPRNNFVISREYIDSELKHSRLAILNMFYEYTKNYWDFNLPIFITICGFLELYKLYLMGNPNWMPGNYSPIFNKNNKFQSIVNGKIDVAMNQKVEIWLGRISMMHFIIYQFLQ